jgi:hypothetical protein
LFFFFFFLFPLPFHSEKVEGIEKEEVKQVLLKDHSGLLRWERISSQLWGTNLLH